jgi:hypothetical protein
LLALRSSSCALSGLVQSIVYGSSARTVEPECWKPKGFKRGLRRGVLQRSLREFVLLMMRQLVSASLAMQCGGAMVGGLGRGFWFSNWIVRSNDNKKT